MNDVREWGREPTPADAALLIGCVRAMLGAALLPPGQEAAMNAVVLAELDRWWLKGRSAESFSWGGGRWHPLTGRP